MKSKYDGINIFEKSKIQILVILIVCAFSMIYGFFQNKEYVKSEKVLFYYTEANEDILTFQTNSEKIKSINSFNKKFTADNSDIKKIEIIPVSANKYIYELVIYSKAKLSDEAIYKVKDDYIKFVKQMDKEVKIIHFTDEYDYTLNSNGINNALIKLGSALLYLLSFYFLLTFLVSVRNANLDFLNNMIFNAVFVAFSSITSVLKMQLTIAAVIFSLIILLKYIKKNSDEAGYITKIFTIGFAVRILAIFAMALLNIKKYGMNISYLQPDEMFYYETSNKIAAVLAVFKWPDLRAITDVSQYGYNLFAGFVKLLNGENFYSLKIINALASCIFTVMVYDFAAAVTKSKKVAKGAGLLMCLMPTMIIFSTFALRDIFISLFIFLILKEIFLFEKFDKNALKKAMKILIYSIVMWYLRNYALILIFMIAGFYVLLKMCIRMKINLVFVFIGALLVLTALLFVISKFYSFSIINMFTSYIRNKGVLGYITGLLLSIINLDFLTNVTGTIYGKSIILRMFYPETLFLIITVPFFFIGIKKLLKINESVIYSLIIMFIGFVTIYKLQYNGWFLRTQLQVFPYQYIIIVTGVIEFVDACGERFKKFIYSIFELPVINKLF